MCSKSSNRRLVGLVVLVSGTPTGKAGPWLVLPSLDKCTSVLFRDRGV